MRRAAVAAVLMTGVGLFWVGAGIGAAAAGPLSPENESALLAERWEEVRAALTGDDSKAEDPVARLIGAHASLATNRGNEAMVLFLSLREEGAKEACLVWAEGFAGKHGESAVARYLLGDAQARAGQLEAAMGSLTGAVEADPDFVPALSARGVVRMMRGDLDGALGDLARATSLRPDFADAHANLGTVWVLKAAARGAIASFERAIAIDPSFALAYNGRGCARFGKGDYDEAIEDFERAFELCPLLVPAGVNEALVLAAVAEETAPEGESEHPGTTLTTRSDFQDLDYSKFRTRQEFESFNQSVGSLFDGDPAEAFRVLSDQRSKVRLALAEATTDLARISRGIEKADDTQRTLQVADSFLGLIPTRSSVVSQPGEGWRQVLDIGRGGLEAGSAIAPDGPGKMSLEVGSRMLDHPMKAMLRAPMYLLEQEAATLGDIGRGRATTLESRMTLLQRFDYDLGVKQNQLLARTISEGRDMSQLDVFKGVRGLSTPRPEVRVPEYRIPSSSPLTQFSVLPGAVGRDIAPAGKEPLVLIDGKADAVRIGAMVRAFEERGVRTFPVPAGMDSQKWAQRMGADRVVTITGEPFDPARRYVLPTIGGPGGVPPGGVSTEEIGRARIDRGSWPVLTSFVLGYGSASPPGEEQPGEEGE